MSNRKEGLLNSGATTALGGFSCAPTVRAETDTQKSAYEASQKVSPTSPLEPILQEIEQAIGAELFHAAIAVALTIPDICAALARDDGRSDPKAYVAWFDDNVPKLEGLPGDQAYKLRCGFLHQARSNRGDMKWTRVMFGLEGAHDQMFLQGNMWNGVMQPDTYVIDAAFFCATVVKAARSWYETHADDPNVRKHIGHVVRYRPNGLAPFVGGVHVLG